MFGRRGEGTVRITQVKGQADEDMVKSSQVREVDLIGNDKEDEAADFGRGRVDPGVIDARRNLSGVCSLWYPIKLELHLFFSAKSRSVVNNEESTGTAPDPLVWSAGSLPSKRRIVHAVRNNPMLPAPGHKWDSGWIGGSS